MVESPEVITLEKIQEAYTRALIRAEEAGTKVYATAIANQYAVTSKTNPDQRHTVTVTGPRFFQCTCSCKGGNHLACAHRAAVVWARKYNEVGFEPKPVTQRCGVCGMGLTDPLHDIACGF